MNLVDHCRAVRCDVGEQLGHLSDRSTRIFQSVSRSESRRNTKPIPPSMLVFRPSQLYLVSWWFLSNVYILALVLGFIVEVFDGLLDFSSEQHFCPLALLVECRSFRRERLRTGTQWCGQYVLRENLIPSFQVRTMEGERRSSRNFFFRRSLKEPSDDQINRALAKYKRMFGHRIP